MVYPNFKNKHREEALVNPGDYLDYKKFKGNLPKKYIITYQSSSINYLKRKYKTKRVKYSTTTDIYVYKDIGFVKSKGIGSPNSVIIIEQLIALGGKTFLNIGTAGGLQHEGVFLCERALRDEGTSYHYVPHGDFSYPNKILTKKLGESMTNNNLKFEKATTWTIDAPYRETKSEIKKYKKQGIATVDMEASALFVVAKYRKVKIASAFVVSDILGEKWEPKFHSISMKRTLNRLIDSAVSCLSSL